MLTKVELKMQGHIKSGRGLTQQVPVPGVAVSLYTHTHIHTSHTHMCTLGLQANKDTPIMHNIPMAQKSSRKAKFITTQMLLYVSHRI